MYCPKCGNQIADGSTFCPLCGNATGQSAPQQPQFGQPVQPQYGQPQYQQPQQQYQQPYPTQPYAQPSAPQTPVKRSKAGIAVIIVAAIVVLAMIGSFAQNAFTSTNDKIENWIDDSGRADSTYYDDTNYECEIFARNDSLVYSFQYKTDLFDEESAAAVLQKSLDNYSATYENVYRYLKEEVPDAKSVIVEYLNKDGKVIAKKEFK